MPPPKLLFSPSYWFKKIAPYLIASAALAAVAYYFGACWFVALALAIFGIVLAKMKESWAATICFLGVAVALMMPGITAMIENVRVPDQQTHATSEPESQKEKLPAGTKASPESSTDQKNPPADTGEQSALGAPNPSSTDTSPMPYPAPDQLPSASALEMATFSPQASPTAPVKQPAPTVVPPTITEAPSAPCESKRRGGSTRFQFGEFVMQIDECHRDGTQERFSGKVQYAGSEEKLLVFHKFIVSNAVSGVDYPVQSGELGESPTFGRTNSWAKIGPGRRTLSFSFIVGSIEEDSKDVLLSIKMPYNQDHGGVVFEELGEKTATTEPDGY